MSTQSVALVTGATSGIGASTAEAYAANGYRVVVAGRRADRGQELVDKIAAAGGTAHFVQADVSQEDQVKALVEETLSTYGQLDVAFNNAGIEGDIFIPSHEQTAENFHKVFDINVLGVLFSMKYEIPAMLEKGGAIINNASIIVVRLVFGILFFTSTFWSPSYLCQCLTSLERFD